MVYKILLIFLGDSRVTRFDHPEVMTTLVSLQNDHIAAGSRTIAAIKNITGPPPPLMGGNFH
jgi:hypothetical protein